jgi:hypothetical protein
LQLGALSGVAAMLDLVPDALHFEVSREAASHAWLNENPNCGVLPAAEWRLHNQAT